MIEMRNDATRHVNYKAATKEAQTEEFDYRMYKTMQEQLDELRQKNLKSKKKKKPWFTIIMIVTTIPMFMNFDMPGSQNMQSVQAIQSAMTPPLPQPMESKNKSTMAHAIQSVKDLTPEGKPVRASPQFGGKVFETNIPMTQIENLNDSL